MICGSVPFFIFICPMHVVSPATGIINPAVQKCIPEFADPGGIILRMECGAQTVHNADIFAYANTEPPPPR